MVTAIVGPAGQASRGPRWPGPTYTSIMLVHYSSSRAAGAEKLHHGFLEIQQRIFGRYRLERTYYYMTQTEDNANDRNQLFVRHLNASHRRLLAYLVSLLGNRHDAEDVLQRASVTMWQRFDTFDIGTDFLAWASTVAFYESRNFQRVANRARMHFNDSLLKTLADERLIDLAHHEHRLDALDRCLELLDEPRQQLVQAAYFGEGSLAMLASQLGRAPQTLYNKLTIIRRMLAECVQRRLMEGAK